MVHDIYCYLQLILILAKCYINFIVINKIKGIKQFLYVADLLFMVIRLKLMLPIQSPASENSIIFDNRDARIEKYFFIRKILLKEPSGIKFLYFILY